MWEFSLNLRKEIFDKEISIFKKLEEFIKRNGGVITEIPNSDSVSIIIAIKEDCIYNTKLIINNIIEKIILVDYKEEYLNKNLYLPFNEEMKVGAFKMALLNFDRETDKFIINKNLIFDKDLYLESFYYFKLKFLREKWGELIDLSNENSDFLLTSESYIEILRFLIDSLEVNDGEINVVKQDDSYSVSSKDVFESLPKLIEEDYIISYLIDASPKKINLFLDKSSKATVLLQQLFDKRIIINNFSNKKIENLDF